MSSPISGFMPIPLAIMPPFMAYQSIVMGDAFGRGFQFGKRKISAMSNEEFNKLDIVKMFEEINSSYHRMIPTVEKSMADSADLQVTIVTELLKIIPALIDALLQGAQQATGGALSGGVKIPKGSLGFLGALTPYITNPPADVQAKIDEIKKGTVAVRTSLPTTQAMYDRDRFVRQRINGYISSQLRSNDTFRKNLASAKAKIRLVRTTSNQYNQYLDNMRSAQTLLDEGLKTLALLRASLNSKELLT